MPPWSMAIELGNGVTLDVYAHTRDDGTTTIHMHSCRDLEAGGCRDWNLTPAEAARLAAVLLSASIPWDEVPDVRPALGRLGREAVERLPFGAVPALGSYTVRDA